MNAARPFVFKLETLFTFYYYYSLFIEHVGGDDFMVMLCDKALGGKPLCASRCEANG